MDKNWGYRFQELLADKNLKGPPVFPEAIPAFREFQDE
jgi:hypothetical protein